MPSPVPNLPPISGIADPQVRAYLQALSNAWSVRNGQVGDGSEKFLTAADLQGGISAFARGGSTGGGGDGGGGAISGVIRAIANSVINSRLFRLLGDRLDIIETPEWFKGRFGAEIVTEQARMHNVTNALAQQTTTAITNINNNLAIARDSITAVSDTVGATAERVTDLQTTVAGVSTRAQEALSLSQSIEGDVSGAWTVKFDANGYVTGAGLGLEGKNGTYTSEFLVRADRFAIGNPAAPGVEPIVPFIVTTSNTTVDGVEYPPGAWMKSAFIADATIDTVHLKNGGIGLVGHAVGGFTCSAQVTVPKNCTYFILMIATSSPWTSGTPTQYHEQQATMSCSLTGSTGGSVTGSGHTMIMYGHPMSSLANTIALQGASGPNGCTVTGSASVTPTSLPYGVTFGVDTYVSLVGIYQ